MWSTYTRTFLYHTTHSVMTVVEKGLEVTIKYFPLSHFFFFLFCVRPFSVKLLPFVLLWSAKCAKFIVSFNKIVKTCWLCAAACPGIRSTALSALVVRLSVCASILFAEFLHGKRKSKGGVVLHDMPRDFSPRSNSVWKLIFNHLSPPPFGLKTILTFSSRERGSVSVPILASFSTSRLLNSST